MLYKGRNQNWHKKKVSRYICDCQQKKNYKTYSHIFDILKEFYSRKTCFTANQLKLRFVNFLSQDKHLKHPYGYKSKICHKEMSDPRQNKKVHPYKSETFQTSQTSQTSPTNLQFVRDTRLQIFDLSVINVRVCQSAHNYIFVNFNKSKKRSFVTTSYITNSTHTINTTNTIKESVTSVNVNKVRSAVIENIKTYNKNYPLHTVKGDSRSSYKSTAGYFFPHAEVKKIKGVLGKIYISTTKNNTIITLIDNKGSTKGWSCSGSLGFKNARKSTTYAAQAATENIVKKAKILGYTHLRILVKGLGRGKQSCLRALSKSGLKVISIEDKTGIPYNGCRLSKSRRV